MPDPTEREILDALKTLGLNCPYYSARRLPSGQIEIITRNGRHVWPKRKRRSRAKPKPKPKPEPQTEPKPEAKA